jgi:nucleotide-binding universal stress UspA family protein
MPFRRVVIGVDFSDATLAAARWAALQLAPDAEVVLAHVLPEPVAPPYLQPYLPPAVEFAAALAPTFYGGLRGLAELIGAERATIHMTAGAPADALARTAAELHADLICVGRSPRRHGGARFGATTAQRLLARTDVPTVIVPAGTKLTPERILAAVDAGVGGERVANVACRLATLFEARVEALHVVDDELQDLAQVAQEVGVAAVDTYLASERGAETPLRATGPTDAKLLRDLASGWVEALLVAMAHAPSRARPVIRFGDAGQQVLAHTCAGDVDLVVIGRGGDGPNAAPSSRLRFVGSTTRLVTWAAPCPVLVLPVGAALPRGGAIDARAAHVGHSQLDDVPLALDAVARGALVDLHRDIPTDDQPRGST